MMELIRTAIRLLVGAAYCNDNVRKCPGNSISTLFVPEAQVWETCTRIHHGPRSQLVLVSLWFCTIHLTLLVEGQAA